MAGPSFLTKVSRAIHKLTAPIQARYDAAGMGRRMRGWQPPSSGPNTAIEGIQKIRDRARDVQRNDWAGESATQKWATTLVGIGISPRLKRIKSTTRRTELKDLWEDFVQQSDADGVLNFYGQQTLAVTTWLAAGECFVRRRDRRLDKPLAVPMQLQLLEPEMCPMMDADTYVGMPIGNRMRSGIELDRSSQRVAYWFYKNHPGDGQQGFVNNGDLLVRIPADQVRHIYMPNRPGALRGVSILAPVLTRLKSVGDYDDAVLERQKLANLFVAFLTTALPNTDDGGVNPLTGDNLSQMADQFVASMEPGLMQELLPGQDVKFANPPEPGTMYHEYIRTQHLGTAAGAGLPYELMSGDIREISDRTLRVIINEFRRLAEQRQWQVIIPMLCQPARDWFCDAAVIAGKLGITEYEDARRVEWAPHGWAYIHPTQDPQGKLIEIEAGMRSRSSVIGDRGDDPIEVDDERAADMEREKKLNLWVDPNAAPGTKPAEDQDEEDRDSEDEKPQQDKPDAAKKARTRR